MAQRREQIRRARGGDWEEGGTSAPVPAEQSDDLRVHRMDSILITRPPTVDPGAPDGLRRNKVFPYSNCTGYVPWLSPA
jgi:hypothetical protein